MNQIVLVLSFAIVLAIPASASAGPMTGIGASGIRLFPNVQMLSLEIEGGVSFGRTSANADSHSASSNPDFLGGAMLVYSNFLMDVGAGVAVQQLPDGVDSRVLYGRLAFRVHIPLPLEHGVLIPSIGFDAGIGHAGAYGLVGNFGFGARVGFAVGRVTPFVVLGYRRHFLDATWRREVNHRQFEAAMGVSIRLAGHSQGYNPTRSQSSETRPTSLPEAPRRQRAAR